MNHEQELCFGHVPLSQLIRDVGFVEGHRGLGTPLPFVHEGKQCSGEYRHGARLGLSRACPVWEKGTEAKSGECLEGLERWEHGDRGDSSRGRDPTSRWSRKRALHFRPSVMGINEGPEQRRVWCVFRKTSWAAVWRTECGVGRVRGEARWLLQQQG